VAAEVRMSVEEYLEILRIIGEQGPGLVQGVREVKKQGKKLVRATRKRTGKKDPKMARALRKANAWGRTKSGRMRKGVTQAKIMKKAHALRRKM
jgi:L-asparaginase/Glu-tRNA(Gln) amidotransferase subunit D